MDIYDFLNPDKPVVRRTISGGTTNGRIRNDAPSTSNRRDDFANKEEYAEEYIEANKQQMLHRYNETSSDDDENFDLKCADHVYVTYNFKRPTANYPITEYRSRILNTIESSPFVVLEGPTACGKTTQVPQYILDNAYRNKKPCNIIIAQPRRIAAASNAERVSSERNWPLGTVVGYKIGFDENKHLSSDTRILFCTTGILLENLIRSKSFGNYTHIILDEVHERNKDMDFLFVVLKKMFVSVVPRPKVKIIIMSATIQSTRFSEYFSFPKDGLMEPAPIITIQQKSKFKIHEYFLEDFHSIAPHVDLAHMDKCNPSIPVDLYQIALHLINRFDDIDKKELPNEDQDERPTILVFLPGIHEITQMETVLNDNWKSLNSDRTRIEVIVLHSTSDVKQRTLAFHKAAPKTRKVILATNIAESSITVPDVKYVLDFCRTRVMKVDTLTNFCALQLSWAARSNCQQRAGRTGRVMNGRCYRFVENQFYNEVMLEDAIPELVTSPLENVILKAKLLEMGPPAAILALAMDHPKLNDIANTILILKEVGALLRTCDGKPNDMDGDISFMGRIMAHLPLDVKIAKFIILGYCFSILDECIVIGAALNSRSIFRDNYRARDNLRLYSQQLRWANSSGSDLFALLHAYTTWSHSHSQGIFGDSSTRAHRDRMNKKEREWADRFCLDIDALHECHIQVNEIKRRLERLNITPGIGVHSIQWNDSEKAIILKVVIAGGFYPNFFARTSLDIEDYSRRAFQHIGTRDPRKTVYYTGFDRDHIRMLYTKPIQKIYSENGIAPESSVQVNFDSGSNKTFVTFKNDDNNKDFENGTENMPGKVCTEVYKSIKMRELRIYSEFWAMKTRNEEIEYAKEQNVPIEYNDVKKPSDAYFDQFCLPRILDAKMTGFITNVESCNRFWFQSKDEEIQVLEFETYVQNYRKEILKPLSTPVLGKLVIVCISKHKGDSYHRAKILKSNAAKVVCQVRLVDTGKKLDCNTENVYEYCGKRNSFFDLPPRCFECALAEIQPSQIRYPNGIWSSEAIALFERETTKRIIELEIYSVVSGKANVFVLCPSTQENFNATLIREHFGEFVEEDYISNYNHLMRKSQQETQLINDKVDNYIDPMCKEYLMEENEIIVEPPPHEKCKTKIRLRGPYSSLSIEPQGLTEATRNAKVVIDRYSVNSIMLENDPQDMTEKYLIAATVCYTDSSKRNINLRYTSQMPNIRGFGPLMAMIFCPAMQVKCNTEKTHYTALRCGLGYDNHKNRPVFEEHDIIFNLNAEITQHDIELINQIRYCLDTLLLTYPGQNEANQLSEKTKREILIRIKNVIVELLEKPRQCVNIDTVDFRWDPDYTSSLDFVMSLANDIYGHRAIFPMHNTLRTSSVYDTNQELLYPHCKQLHGLAQFILPGAVDKKNMKSEKNSYFFNLGEFVIFKHEHVVE